MNGGGAIVTANIGASAGGNVVAEPRDASYATWPVFVQKTIDDVLSIYRDNLRAGREGEKSPPPPSNESGPERAQAFAGVFTRDTFILLAVGLVALVGFGLLKFGR